MGSVEARSSRTEAPKERIHRSVRVFCVAAKRVSELEAELSAGIPIEEQSLVRVVLARKNDTRLVTALGGEILPGEDVIHASGRKVFEESLLTRESQRKMKKSVVIGIPVPYVRADTGKRCEATLTVMPVRSATVALHEPREPKNSTNVYKITELIDVTPKELSDLFSRGRVITSRGEELHMFGHLTQVAVRDVVLTDKARRIQNQEFSRVLDEVYEYEYTLKQEMKNHINRVRRWYNKPRISSFGDCGQEELKEAFLAAQMYMGLSDERERDREHGKKPARPADLLNANVYLSEFTRDQFVNSQISVPTEEVRRVRNILKYAVRGVVTELYKRMNRDITEFSSNGKDDIMYVDTIAALKAVWPDVVNLPLTERTQFVSVLNDRFVSELSAVIWRPQEVLRRAFTMPRAIAGHIADELPGKQFQQHHPINEVANAKPLTLLLFALGLHPNRNEGPVQDVVRDSLTAWSHILTSIPVVEQHMRADNSVFEGALDTFLEDPRVEEIFLDDPDVPHKIYHRMTRSTVGDRKLHLIIDERPLKTDERATIKSYQTTEIYDDFSINFVIANDNFRKKERDNIAVRLQKVRELRDEYLAHFQDELRPSGYDAGIVEGTHKTEVLQALKTYLKIQTNTKKKRFINNRKSGERPGSFGNIILREKFVVWYTQPDGIHYCEVSIYPIETTTGTPLEGSDWVAFDDKIKDDKSRRHAGDRLIQTDVNDPTGPALIELLEPPSWSAARFAPLRALQHNPKKKRRK